jgi:hypothetical protein
VVAMEWPQPHLPEATGPEKDRVWRKVAALLKRGQEYKEWKYVTVRRLALSHGERLNRGTQWVVFEPNDEPLWAQIRLNVGAFMHGLFRRGALQGHTPREAYFVKCDKETTTQNDINLGIDTCRRFRPSQAGGVRDHQDPADCCTDSDVRRRRGGNFGCETEALRPV